MPKLSVRMLYYRLAPRSMQVKCDTRTGISSVFLLFPDNEHASRRLGLHSGFSGNHPIFHGINLLRA